MILTILRNIAIRLSSPVPLGRWGYHFDKIKFRNYYD